MNSRDFWLFKKQFKAKLVFRIIFSTFSAKLCLRVSDPEIHAIFWSICWLKSREKDSEISSLNTSASDLFFRKNSQKFSQIFVIFSKSENEFKAFSEIVFSLIKSKDLRISSEELIFSAKISSNQSEGSEVEEWEESEEEEWEESEEEVVEEEKCGEEGVDSEEGFVEDSVEEEVEEGFVVEVEEVGESEEKSE